MDLDTGFVLVTEASGQIGRQVCSMLSAMGRRVLPVDKDPSPGGVYCDVTSKESVTRLYREYPVRAVIDLAAALPTIFHAAPLAGAEVNLTGSVNVLSSAASEDSRRQSNRGVSAAEIQAACRESNSSDDPNHFKNTPATSVDQWPKCILQQHLVWGKRMVFEFPCPSTDWWKSC